MVPATDTRQSSVAHVEMAPSLRCRLDDDTAAIERQHDAAAATVQGELGALVELDARAVRELDHRPRAGRGAQRAAAAEALAGLHRPGALAVQRVERAVDRNHPRLHARAEEARAVPQAGGEKRRAAQPRGQPPNVLSVLMVRPASLAALFVERGRTAALELVPGPSARHAFAQMVLEQHAARLRKSAGAIGRQESAEAPQPEMSSAVLGAGRRGRRRNVRLQPPGSPLERRLAGERIDRLVAQCGDGFVEQRVGSREVMASLLPESKARGAAAPGCGAGAPRRAASRRRAVGRFRDSKGLRRNAGDDLRRARGKPGESQPQARRRRERRSSSAGFSPPPGSSI
jgi:hypothetical protein